MAVINLVPAAKPVEKPGVRQLSEFSLRGSNPCSGATCNFAQIELFVTSDVDLMVVGNVSYPFQVQL